MVEKVTFRDSHLGLAHFNITCDGQVKVASVLTRFRAEQIEYKDSKGDFTVLDADKEGWSMATFPYGSTVDIRCIPKSGVQSITIALGQLGKGNQGEGLALRREAGFLTKRYDTCMNLLRMAFQRRLVVVKAPPRSGKTSLLQLTAELAMSVEGVRRVLMFSATAVSKDYQFETAWSKETGVDWTNACTSPPSTPRDGITLIIGDEIQNMYNVGASGSQRFWGLAKSVSGSAGFSSPRPSTPPLPNDAGAGSPFGKNVVLIMAVSLGSFGTSYSGSSFISTPLDFADEIVIGVSPTAQDPTCPALKLTPQEVDELFESFCRLNAMDPGRWQNLKAYMMERSECQPGLLTHFLDEAAKVNPGNFRGREAMLEERLIAQVSGEEFLKGLSSLRGFINVGELLNKQDVCRVIEKLIYVKQVDMGIIRDPDTRTVLQDLVRLGQLVLSGEMLEFASHLHVEYFAYKYYRSTLPSFNSLEDMNIVAFLKAVISRMSGRQLNASIGTDAKGHPFEANYQMEFYRACISVLPAPHLPQGARAYLSPEVGHLFGAPGLLDFVLQPLGWGFELLREGSNMNEHLRRFDEGAKYWNLQEMGIIKTFVVIDLRAGGQKPRQNKNDAIWFVEFGEGYKNAVLTHGATNLAETIQLSA